MDCSKIKIGMTISNYKDFCNILGDKAKTGNGKIAQMKDWNCYINWEKKGYKFIITEIYDKPIIKEDSRHIGNNSLYQVQMQILILDHLAKQATEDNLQIMELTNNQILSLTGMCNEAYITKAKDHYLMNECDISQFHLNDFYRNTGLKFCKIINSMLMNLKSRFILNIKDKYKIKMVDRINEHTEKEYWATADEDEELLIMEIKRRALAKMGLRTEIQVIMKFKTSQFYDLVNKLLYDEYGWKGCYKYHQVSFHQNELIKDIKRHKQEAEVLKNEQLRLNGKVVNYFNLDVEKRYYNNQQEIQEILDKILYTDKKQTEEQTQLAYKKKFQYNHRFIEEQKNIIKYLIQI